MVRYRIRWTKCGRSRYISARDLTAVWERALRRADVPIAYSEGFTPHAKVSFPDALAVGVESTGEYAELTFVAPIDARVTFTALSRQLPDGMDILTFVPVPDGAKKLASMLPATLWQLSWIAPDGAQVADVLASRCDDLLAAEQYFAVRQRPSGSKTIDVRPATLTLKVKAQPTDDLTLTRTTLHAVLKNDGNSVRPHDLFSALNRADIAVPHRILRVVQGTPDVHGVVDALSGVFVPLDEPRDVEAA